MENENKQKADVAFDWICRIIETCVNQFHFDGVDRLIELFMDNFKDEQRTMILKDLRHQKFNEVHNILY